MAAIFPAPIKTAIREFRAAKREAEAIRAQISAMREAEGVSALASWQPPYEVRDALETAEHRALHADQKVSAMIRAADREAA